MFTLDTQTLAILGEQAHTDAVLFQSEGGTLATIGDWDSEAFADFRTRGPRFFQGEHPKDVLAAWDAAWEYYHARFVVEVAGGDSGDTFMSASEE